MLVVMVVIMVLIALLLPAIQATRENARRTSCVAHLHQIGLALENYRHAHSVLPPGTVNPTGPIQTLSSGYHYSWMVQILPFVDVTNVFNHFDSSVGVYDPLNEKPATQRIDVYLCPSMPIGGASTSYAGCHHDREAPIDVDNDGVLFLNSSIKLEDITDGASHTIFIGEAGSMMFGWASGTSDTLRNVGSSLGGGYNPYASLRDRGDNSTKKPGSASTVVGSFQMVHVGGTLFGFGDGTVRLVSETVDNKIFRRLANRHDGEFTGRF
ncbi:MAG: prepilin-type cleavage/methylation domain-containing protein [Planctomycetaceae bacterium]|nr:prepilin-type cleavage/methylation domain-containing protein [Planctomycetaceae bacterium]